MFSLERHRALFQVPELRALLLSSIAGRLPIGIAGLAILLFVQGRSGSFVLAGTASGLYVLGLGLVAPFLGRLIDRVGPRPVLAVCAVLYPAALIGLAALVLLSAHPAWVGIMAVMAGSTLPPVSAVTRALYPRVVLDTTLLPTAYSADSALVEAVFVLGPSLVAFCVALGRPEAAILVAAFASAIGTAMFVRTAAVRRWTAASAQTKRDAWGVLGNPRLLVLFATTVLYSISFGLLEVAVTAHAASKGSPAMAGVALALASLGSGVGALVYGARHWRAPLHRQLLVALAMMASGLLLLVPLDNLTIFALANVVTGVPMATVIATQSLLVSRYAPRERLAEAFTWSTTCLLIGVSAGIAAGGVLAEFLAAWWLLAVAAGATALAAALAAACLKE